LPKKRKKKEKFIFETELLRGFKFLIDIEMDTDNKIPDDIRRSAENVIHYCNLINNMKWLSAEEGNKAMLEDAYRRMAERKRQKRAAFFKRLFFFLPKNRKREHG
jgi:dihydroneopterin aldolase